MKPICKNQLKESKESKADRFCRLAEARVNKILKMMQLLGNCSNTIFYEYTPEQVEQIFQALQEELDQAHERFLMPTPKKRVRFTLSQQEDVPAEEENELPVPKDPGV